MRQNTEQRAEEQRPESEGDSTPGEGPERQVPSQEAALSTPRVMTHSHLAHKRWVSLL